jgi:hypothetical protein
MQVGNEEKGLVIGIPGQLDPRKDGSQDVAQVGDVSTLDASKYPCHCDF